MQHVSPSVHPAVRRECRPVDHPIGWFLSTFAVVPAVSLAAAGLLALSTMPAGRVLLVSPDGLAFLGLCMLVGAAGFAAGGLAGFLFGVPRVRIGVHAPAAAPVVSNTNLEQLSDWLTKILIGVGLVQVHEVNRLLCAFRDQIDAALTARAPAGAGLAACLILVGATIAGFLATYLKAKTDLMRAFREPMAAVRSQLGEVAQRLIVDAARTVLNRPSARPDSISRGTAARLVQSVPPGTDDPELHRLLGLAQAVLKNFAPAAEALEQSIALRAAQGLPDDLDLAALTTRARALAGGAAAGGGMTATGPSTVEGGLAAMFAHLYGGRYDAVIALGEQLARDGAAQASGRLWLYLARAYGQRHAALIRAGDPDLAGGTQAEVAAARDGALAAVRAALRLDDDRNGPALRLAWDPTVPDKPTAEHDLESLYTDPAFITLLSPA